MSSLATNYKVNNGNYSNKDLSDIFVPLANCDFGTLRINQEIAFRGLTVGNAYININNGLDASNNVICSFTIDPSGNLDPSGNQLGNIVSVGVDRGYASFIQFTEPGIYVLQISLQGLSGYNPENGYNLTTYMRFSNSVNENPATAPTLNILSASHNGNSASDDNTTTSNNNNNLLYMYNSSGDGYPVFRAYTLFNGSGQCFYNLTTLSITLKLEENDFTNGICKIYPQWAGDITVIDNPWIFEGNWKVTKLYG
jgi:hypothetical protein